MNIFIRDLADKNVILIALFYFTLNNIGIVFSIIEDMIKLNCLNISLFIFDLR